MKEKLPFEPLVVNEDGRVDCSDEDFYEALQGGLGLSNITRDADSQHVLITVDQYVVAIPHEGKMVVGVTRGPLDDELELFDEKYFDINDVCGVVEYGHYLANEYHKTKTD